MRRLRAKKLSVLGFRSGGLATVVLDARAAPDARVKCCGLVRRDVDPGLRLDDSKNARSQGPGKGFPNHY